MIGVVACLYPLQVSAQDKLSVQTPKADFVSQCMSGAVLISSPVVEYSSSHAGFTPVFPSMFGAASHSPNGKEGGSKEWDINLGYTYRNL